MTARAIRWDDAGTGRGVMEGMTRAQQIEKATEIANQHGCDVASAANGRHAIQVQRVHAMGWPHDDQRIARCRVAIIAAGVTQAKWWLS